MIPPLMGKKKAVGLIIGGMGEPKMEEEMSPLSALAKELIGAIKADDAEGVASALRACWDSFESEETEYSEED